MIDKIRPNLLDQVIALAITFSMTENKNYWFGSYSWYPQENMMCYCFVLSLTPTICAKIVLRFYCQTVPIESWPSIMMCCHVWHCVVIRKIWKNLQVACVERRVEQNPWGSLGCVKFPPLPQLNQTVSQTGIKKLFCSWLTKGEGRGLCYTVIWGWSTQAKERESKHLLFIIIKTS